MSLFLEGRGWKEGRVSAEEDGRVMMEDSAAEAGFMHDLWRCSGKCIADEVYD